MGWSFMSSRLWPKSLFIRFQLAADEGAFGGGVFFAVAGVFAVEFFLEGGVAFADSGDRSAACRGSAGNGVHWGLVCRTKWT